MKRNFSFFSNFGVTRLCGLWLYYWYWPSQGSGYYQSPSSPLLLTISQSLHSGEWGLFCHNFLFQFFTHHRHTTTSISMTVIQSLYEPSEFFSLNIINIYFIQSITCYKRGATHNKSIRPWKCFWNESVALHDRTNGNKHSMLFWDNG